MNIDVLNEMKYIFLVYIEIYNIFSYVNVVLQLSVIRHIILEKKLNTLLDDKAVDGMSVDKTGLLIQDLLMV